MSTQFPSISLSLTGVVPMEPKESSEKKDGRLAGRRVTFSENSQLRTIFPAEAETGEGEKVVDRVIKTGVSVFSSGFLYHDPEGCILQRCSNTLPINTHRDTPQYHYRSFKRCSNGRLRKNLNRLLYKQRLFYRRERGDRFNRGIGRMIFDHRIELLRRQD